MSVLVDVWAHCSRAFRHLLRVLNVLHVGNYSSLRTSADIAIARLEKFVIGASTLQIGFSICIWMMQVMRPLQMWAEERMPR